MKNMKQIDTAFGTVVTSGKSYLGKGNFILAVPAGGLRAD